MEEQENLINKSPEKEERPTYHSSNIWNKSPKQRHTLGGNLPSYVPTPSVKVTTANNNDIAEENGSRFSLWRLCQHLFGSVLFSVFFYIFLFPLLFVFVLGVILAAIVFGVYCIYLACMNTNPASPLPLLVFLPFVLVLYGILLVFGAQRTSSHSLTVFWGRLCFSMGVIAGFSTPFYLWWNQVLGTLELLYAGLGTVSGGFIASLSICCSLLFSKLLLTISFAMTILLLESDILSPRQVIATTCTTQLV